MPSPAVPKSLFGRRLRAARLALGMSQAELGGVLGLEDVNSAAPRISRYELGNRDPDLATAEALAKALGVPVAYFHATPDAIAEAILLMAQLTPAQQVKAVEAIKRLVKSPKR